MTSADFLRVVSGPSRGRQADLVGRVVIGRSDVALRVDDPTTSRTHATVQVGREVTVADAGSARGTKLDRATVTTPVPFPIGGTLAVGKSDVRRLRTVRHARSGGVDVVLRGPAVQDRTYTVRDRMLAGREQGSDIRIDDPGVSRTHLVLELRDGSLTVADARSRGGVAVNGRRIQAATAVRAGDEIEFGGTAWTLRVADAVALAAPQEFRVRYEAEDRVDSLHIDADPASSVAAVADAVATSLGVAAGRGCTFYRDRDGVVLHPEDAWSAVALERGELLVLAEVDVGEAVSPDPGGRRARVIRPGSRTVTPPAGVVVEAPRAPESAALRGRGIGWQLAGGAVGVVGGLVIALALNNWLFAVIGGVTGIGAVAFSVLGDQSRRRHRVREFKDKIAAAEQKAMDAVQAQTRAVVELCPGPDRWRGLVDEGALWERQPGDADFLRLRLGTGERRAAVRIEVPRDDPEPEFAAAFAALSAERLLAGVPVQGPGGGVLGIIGPNRAVDDLLRSVVFDAAVHHAPSALGIHLLGERSEWDFALWLPHVADAAGSRLATRDGEFAGLGERIARDIDTGRRVLVVAGFGASSRWREILHDWRAEHGLVIVAASTPQGLPREATAWLVLDDAGGRVEGAYPDAPVGRFAPDRLDFAFAEKLALRAAGLVDAHAAGAAAPVARSVLELSGARSGGKLDVGRNWRRGYDRLNAVLGVTDDGAPLEVDLKHTVVAGTTGSGKSELLATLLASLIARQSPADLTLFLIDFKGGATFNRFAAAPHVVGVVTDLESDERLARRAFQSLDVEFRRRKALLGSVRANDIDRYREIGTGEPLSTLLVVIDEFALLAQSVPEVKSQLDTIAAQGRSLGIFLVLATQSPTGVVTPAIRTNTDLWLSLRVVSDQESREILGSVEAARLPVDAPGRALMRRGAEANLTAFQTARVTVVAGAAGAALVRVRPFGPASPHRPPTSSQAAEGVEDLDLLITEVQDEVRLGHRDLPHALWLPPLPPNVSIDELPDVQPEGFLPVRIGLADLVSEQRQPTYCVDIGTTGLLITGAPRSGRSTALLQIAADLAESHPPGRVHLYAIHANGALDPIARLAHAGGIVQLDDAERLTRLLDRLTSLIEARRSTPRSPSDPRIVLLVDDYSAVREALEQRSHGRLHDQLVAIVTSGRPAGVFVALAASQPTDLRMAALAGLGHRLMLKVVDRADYQAIEWRPALNEMPPALPGRAVIVGGVEVQVVDADLDRAEQVARAWPADDAPFPIQALPRSIAFSELPPVPSDSIDVIGLGGREVGAIGVDASPGAHLAVLGEAGTGRSTALLAVALAHLRRPASRVLMFAPRGGPLEALVGRPDVERFGVENVDGLLASAAAHPSGTLLVIDDADRWPSSAGDGLERLLRQARDSGLRAVIGARAGDWTRWFEGWVKFVGSLKSALLLSSFAELGANLDVRLEPPPTAPSPGRGFLVVRGAVDFIQVAEP